MQHMIENKRQEECRCCGTCCTKGGPALHDRDRKLLECNLLEPGQLITIREGEPVFTLTAETVQPARTEIIKIKGRGSEWSCLFYGKERKSCLIYESRPLECTLLKCWDTAELEKVAGRNLLSRHDIIADDDPVLSFMALHDRECSLKDLQQILAGIAGEKSRRQALLDLAGLVNKDLTIRGRACGELNLDLDLELFFFGRPLFKILQQFGIETVEEHGNCRLSLVSHPSAGVQPNHDAARSF